MMRPIALALVASTALTVPAYAIPNASIAPPPGSLTAAQQSTLVGAVQAGSATTPGGALTYNTVLQGGTSYTVPNALGLMLPSAGGDASATVSSAVDTTTKRTASARASDVINVMDSHGGVPGAVGDTQYQLNAYTTTVGSNVLVAANPYLFSASMVGKAFVLQGAGVSGAGLVGTITGYTDGAHITLSVNASTAISAGTTAAPVYNLLTYGTDNTAAINAALAYARTLYQSNSRVRVYTANVYFPARNFLCLGSLNFTGFQFTGLSITGEGARITSAAVGQVAVDMIGDRYIHWEGPRIFGEEFAPPTYGLQLGRIGDTTNASDNQDIDDLRVEGSFSIAAVINENSETTNWSGLRISNDQPNAYGYIADGVNHFRLTSQFVTWTQPSEGIQSFDENTFTGPIFATSGEGSDPLWIGGAHRLRIIGGYTSNTDQTATTRIGTYLYFTADKNPQVQIDLDMHTEQSTTNTFMFGGAAGLTSASIEGFRLRDNAAFGSAAVFAIDPASSLTSVTLPHADVDLFQIGNGITLLDNPAKWFGSGDIYLPAGTANQFLSANWSGRTCTDANICTTNDTLTVQAAATASARLGSPTDGSVIGAAVTPIGSNYSYWLSGTAAINPGLTFSTAPSGGTTAIGHFDQWATVGANTFSAGTTATDAYANNTSYPAYTAAGVLLPFQVQVSANSSGVATGITGYTPASGFVLPGGIIPAGPYKICTAYSNGTCTGNATFSSMTLYPLTIAMDTIGLKYNLAAPPTASVTNGPLGAGFSYTTVFGTNPTVNKLTAGSVNLAAGGSVNVGIFSVQATSAGKLVISTGTTNLFSVDSAGNVLAKGTIAGSSAP